MNRAQAREVLLGLLIFLLVVSAYVPALRGDFIWDDDTNVTKNPVLADPGGLRRIWADLHANEQYYPLTHTSFWLERRVYGLRPFGYHLNNVLLHSASAVILWRVLLLLGVPGAWPAAAVFAVHPVHVESVAWVTERKNTLSGFFMVLSSLCFVRFFLGQEQSGPPRRRQAWYLFSLLFFLAALLSKTAVALLPVGLTALLWWKRGKLPRRDLPPLIPFFALGAGLGLLTAWLERSHVGAVGAEFNLSVPIRLLVAGRAFWSYIEALFWPGGLVFVRPRWDIRAVDPMAWIYPVMAVAALLAMVHFQRRIGRGPLAATIWYTAMIFPALGFFNVYFMRYSFVQDHFQYYASIGVIVLGVGGAARLWDKTSRNLARGPARMLGAFLPLIVMAPLWALTWRQAHVYKDNETLWKDTLAKNPSAFIAHSNYGLLLFERGDLNGALLHQREALRLHSGWEEYYNMGNTLAAQRRISEALDAYRESLKRRPAPMTYTNMGIELHGIGRQSEAVAAYREALKLDPSFYLAHYNLGLDLLKQGALVEALPHLRKAVLIAPGDANAHQNLGAALSRLGLSEEARSHFAEAARLRGAIKRP